MALTPTASLYAASLAIYLLLLPLIAYIWYCHGRRGFFGWFFISGFATLQIVAGGILVSENENPSLAGSIVSTVGLSPLLLGIHGIVHEIQLKIMPQNGRRTLMTYLFLHSMVVAGIALTAVGAANLYSSLYSGQPNADISNDITLWKVGSVLVLLAWALIAVSAIITLRTVKDAAAYGRSRSNTDELKLIWPLLCSVPFAGIRAIFGLVYAVTQRQDLSPSTGSMAAKMLLQFLPQLIAVLLLLVGGFRSKDMNDMPYTNRGEVYPLNGTDPEVERERKRGADLEAREVQ